MLSRDSIHRSFYVVLHDVTPRFASEIDEIVAALTPLIGRQFAAAVVPHWDADDSHRLTEDFADRIDRHFGEVLLHGFTHRRHDGAGTISALTGACDEFNGYSHAEAHERLDAGQGELQRAFGRRSSGFIAPTFQLGRLKLDRFHEHDLHFTVGFYAIHFHGGRRVPVATWCWDMGHLRFLGVLGHYYGTARYRRLRRSALPCLAIHPVDVRRGFLGRIVRLIESLLAEGRQPVLMREAAQVTASTR